jgi:hypothetical protein
LLPCYHKVKKLLSQTIISWALSALDKIKGVKSLCIAHLPKKHTLSLLLILGCFSRRKLTTFQFY